MGNRADQHKDIFEIFREGTLIDRALEKAARQAVQEHRDEGLPLAVWRDGKVVWMTAEELEAKEP